MSGRLGKRANGAQRVDPDAKHQPQNNRGQIRDCKRQIWEPEAIKPEAKKSQDGLVVSEHSIIRYLERIVGINMGEIRRAIAPDSAMQKILQSGDGCYDNGHGVFLVVKEKTIVTVLDHAKAYHD